MRELARILDLHFGQMERLFVRLDDIDRRSGQTQDLVRQGRDLQSETALAVQRKQLQMQSEIATLVKGVTAAMEPTEGRWMEKTVVAYHGLTTELKEMRAELSESRDRVLAGISGLMRPALTVDADGFDVENPEVALLAHLRGSLVRGVALDIGANSGAISERLLAAGYQVYAFEPCPTTFAALTARLGGRPGFRSLEVAIGPADCTMDLYLATDRTPGSSWPADLYHSLVRHTMPESKAFTRRIPVKVRSLESLRRSNQVPAAIGVVKIDTEGYDLEVIRGMGDLDCDILMAEFWDRRMMFAGSGTVNDLEVLVDTMRERGYRLHIAVYRVAGKPASYYCNNRASIAESWGNVIFFKDRELFREALEWCSSVLPVTYFRFLSEG